MWSHRLGKCGRTKFHIFLQHVQNMTDTRTPPSRMEVLAAVSAAVELQSASVTHVTAEQVQSLSSPPKDSPPPEKSERVKHTSWKISTDFNGRDSHANIVLRIRINNGKYVVDIPKKANRAGKRTSVAFSRDHPWGLTPGFAEYVSR